MFLDYILSNKCNPKALKNLSTDTEQYGVTYLVVAVVLADFVESGSLLIKK